MKSLLTVALLVLCSTLAFPQTTIHIEIGEDVYERSDPTTLEDAITLSHGLASTLNKVIASYLQDSSEASEAIKQILGQVQDVKKTAQGMQVATGGAPFPVFSLPTFAVGGFVQANPVPALGGFLLNTGPVFSMNLFQYMLVSLGVGFHISQNQTAPLVSMSAQWWLK